MLHRQPMEFAMHASSNGASNPKHPIDPCLNLIQRWRAGVALFEASDGGDEAERTYGHILPEFEGAPAAQSLAGAIAALELAHEEDGHADAITGSMVMSALTFLRTLVPAPARPATRAEVLAYREWLHVEASVLDDELPELGGCVPRGTGGCRMHVPSGVFYRDVEQPSARAIRIMTAAGVNLLDVERRAAADAADAA